MRNILFQLSIVIFSITIFSASGYSASGAFQVYPGGLSYPDGSVTTTAPKDGKTIISGSGAPTQGATLDDYYLDYTNHVLYGPYNGSSWGTGVSLVGPQGPIGLQGIKGDPGAQGAAGANGLDGKSILTGTLVPDKTIGNIGDLYLNTSTHVLYGPKTESTMWEVGATSLVGPDGSPGTPGATGLTGPQGLKGDTGAQGSVGPAGPKGDTGATGAGVTGRYQLDTQPEQSFTIKGKYLIRATRTNYNMSTLPIARGTIDSYCGDLDGCSVTLSMLNWDGTPRKASLGPFKFFIDTATGNWRIDFSGTSSVAGTDGNGTTEHVISGHSCYFTDGTYVSGADLGDTSTGFGLLVWNQYPASTTVCELLIED